LGIGEHQMQELIWGSIVWVAIVFCAAWGLAMLAGAYWVWKNRDKTWEDDIDWGVEEDVQPSTANYVVIAPTKTAGEYAAERAEREGITYGW